MSNLRLLAVSLLVGILTQTSISSPVSEPAPRVSTPVLVRATTEIPPSRARRLPTKIAHLPKAWRQLAYCESRYKLHAVSPSGEHFGLWQLHRGFYAHFNINPKKATFSQQWMVAQYVYKRQGARAWSCARFAGLT